MALTRANNYSSVFQQPGIFAAGVTVGTYWFDQVGTATASGTGLATARPFLVLSPADFPGASVLNLQVSLATTATQTGATFTFGLYPIANTGTTTTIPTLGTVVTGSTVAFVAPATAAESRNNSGDFALPATDLYQIGCVLSGASTAATSLTQITALLRVR